MIIVFLLYSWCEGRNFRGCRIRSFFNSNRLLYAFKILGHISVIVDINLLSSNKILGSMCYVFSFNSIIDALVLVNCMKNK